MKLLVLTPRLTWPPAGGDRVIVLNHLRLLSPEMERIHVLSFIERKEQEADARELESQFRNLTVQTVLLPPWRSKLNALLALVFSRAPLQVAYYHSRAYSLALRKLLQRERFDACYIQLLRMAPYASLLGGMRTILNLTDCLTLRYERSAPFVTGRQAIIEGVERRRITRAETHAPGLVDVAFTVAVPDRDRLVAMGARGRVEVLPMGVDLDYFQPEPAGGYEPHTVVFVGNLHYPPNQDAVRHLLDSIWPLVRRRRPDAKLDIVGVFAPAWLAAYDGKEGVCVQGAVPDVRPFYRRAAMSLCPIRIGAGMQTKILESLALGVPVVASPVGFEGLEAGEDDGVMVAATPDECADGVLRIFNDPDLRARCSSRGRAFVERYYRWADRREALLALLRGR